MRKLCFVILMVLFAANSWASDVPVLQLEDGENEIKVSIANNYFTDLQDVRVSVDSAQLPEWLSIMESIQIIDIQKSQKSTEQLVLNLTVDSAPADAVANLPLSLSDKNGNSWNFDISVQARSVKPVATVLHNNYPNPFNPATTISYSLKSDGHAKLAIYNSLGQLVRTLIDGPETIGNHSVQWDGRNDAGQSVSSGVYLYTLIAGNVKQTKRMMMVE